jgi:sugar-specific transcriptional regulator TrmB
MKTGLTRHESELYIALCREGELTGYEAAKITGIPRANAYQALSGLVDKGGAYIIEGSVQHYTAVPVDEYCANIMQHLKEVIERIRHECPELRKPSEPYITITGFKHITDKMKNIINNAKERVYVSISEKDFRYIKEELEKAYEKGLKVVAVTSGNITLPGATVHKINKQPGQVRLIADSSHVLTGDISGSDYDTCLYSKNKPLVELIKDSIKNEIRLSTMEVRNNNE